jgi:hypothetical protein
MCFLFFVLFQHLSAGLPTVFQMFPDQFFLFTSQGASVLSSQTEAYHCLPAGTWALSDSNEVTTQPCNAFLGSFAVWVVQASSPKEAQWKAWTKQRHASVYVMDCISADELITFG